MKTLIFFILCFLGVRARNNETCPSNVKCLTSEKITDCPLGSSLVLNSKVHNCCPGCVEGLLGSGKKCATNEDCVPGTYCNTKNTCTIDGDVTGQWCAADNLKTTNPYFTPECLPDGTYAPKQCRGEIMNGKCFCYSKKGKRIFGEEKWAKAENMTCACSRQVSDMMETRTDVSIHCNDLGNFETLQCDQGVCWCADEYTGEPYSIVVPEKMMDTLTCYSESQVGTQYLRVCDSQLINQEFARKLIANHGSTKISFPQIFCNYDGSYARYQIIDNKKKCTYRDKTQLTDGIGSDSGDYLQLTCNCAYDKYVATLNGETFTKECAISGNYKGLQIDNGKYYCVDQDGFAVSDLVEDASKLPCK